jgi:hypothetical protein
MVHGIRVFVDSGQLLNLHLIRFRVLPHQVTVTDESLVDRPVSRIGFARVCGQGTITLVALVI